MNTPHLQSVIICNNETAGTGTELDPVRRITTIYSQSGDMLGMDDDLVRFTAKDVIAFTIYCIDRNVTDLKFPNYEEAQKFIYEVLKPF